MKKLLLLALVCGMYVGSVTQPETFKAKGKISPNSENENKEPDPVYSKLSIDPAAIKKTGQEGNAQQVSQLANGMNIVTDIVDRMINSEYSFSLLSSHKYMVNDCLGMKVSSGQFKLKFSNPGIEVTNSGHIKIRLEVNKINFSALKVRVKPRAPDLSDPNPCHFSGKFEIGGEATDLSVTLTLNLVVSGMEGSSGLCFFAFGAPVSIKWNIGGLNLKPHPNALDNVAKEMVEDALNTGLDGLLYTKFIQLSREVIPKYYEACEGIYNAERITNISNAVMAGAEVKDTSRQNISKKWETTANNLKATTGRLLMDNPAGSIWTIYFYSMAGNKYVTSFNQTNNRGVFVLSPGAYKITINNAPVQNVPIQKGHDTKLETGVLDIPVNGVWYLYDETGKTSYTSGDKPEKLVLPVGNYKLTVNNAPIENVQVKKGPATRLKTGVLDITENDVWYLYDEMGNTTYTSGNKPEKLVLPEGKYTLKVGGNEKVMVVQDEVRLMEASDPNNESDFWVVTPLEAMTEGIGKLSIIIPKDTTITINGKLITVPLFIRDTVRITNASNPPPILDLPKYLEAIPHFYLSLNREKFWVPIRPGKETRIKAGFLVISRKETEGASGFNDPMTNAFEQLYGTSDFPDETWTWTLYVGNTTGYNKLTGKKGAIFALLPGEYTIIKERASDRKKVVYHAMIKDGEWTLNGVKQ